MSSSESERGGRFEMSSSDSERETPPPKKLCSSQSFNSMSSRQSERAQKRWAVLDFTEEHSLIKVPASGILTIQMDSKVKTECSCPKSKDEQNVGGLNGVFKEYFSSHREAESYETEKFGSVSTSSVMDIEERLAVVEKKANLSVKKKHRTSPTDSNRHPKKNMTCHNPSPSAYTSKSILDVNAESEEFESPAMEVSFKRKAVDGHCKTDRKGAVTPKSAHKKLGCCDSSQIHNKTERDKREEIHVSRKRRDIQDQILLLLNELKEDIREIKEDVRIIKTRMEMDPESGRESRIESRIDGTNLENPFELLRSFGFQAKTVEQLLEREKQFSDGHPLAEKNRAILLRILLELAPKPKKANRVNALDVTRCSMRKLAGDWLWQYICANGRSGNKIPMGDTMPRIKDIILLTTCRTTGTDPKEAGAALSNYLKNTSTRVTSKKYRAKIGVGAKNERSQPHSQGRQAHNSFHSRGTNYGESSGDEECQSLLSSLYEMSDWTDSG